VEPAAGSTDHPVIRRLLEAPREFSFFQAVRLLELALPDATPLGGRGPASREAVRLRPSTSLSFQSAEVTAVTPPAAEGQPYRLTTTVAGLYGANSPLPGFYSDEILHYETVNAPDPDPVRGFLDLVNHRLLSLLYRAWAKYRWAFSFRGGASDAISRCMFHLIGLGDPHVRDTLGVPAQRLLRYAGFITQLPHGSTALGGVLSDYFDDVPVQVDPCLPRWVDVAEADQNRLGVRNTTLAESLTVGARVRDRAGKFGLRVGPLPALAPFVEFLPIGCHSRPLGALVRFLVPDPLEYDLFLGLEGPAVPALQLTRTEEAARLGWTSWIRADATSCDRWERFRAPALEEASQERALAPAEERAWSASN
jgi:type VI secretion system protein ImpH